MRGKRMSEHVRTDPLQNIRLYSSRADSPLDFRFVLMMASADFCLRINTVILSGKYPEPTEIQSNVWIFPFKSIWHIYARHSTLNIDLMKSARNRHLIHQRLYQRLGQRNSPILIAFSTAHSNNIGRKLYIFESQRLTFSQAQTSSVHQPCHQVEHLALDTIQYFTDIITAQNCGQTFGLFRRKSLDAFNFYSKHLLIHELNRIMTLVPRGCAHLAGIG